MRLSSLSSRGLVLLPCLAIVGGCSSGDDGGGDGDGGPDAGAACAIADALGPAGQLAEVEAERHNAPGSMGASKVYSLSARLTEGEPGDFLVVDLWDGFGAFSGGPVAAGTYPIAGADTSADSCGACVYVMADVDPATDEPGQAFVARSGTLVIDAVLPDLTGSLAGLEFQEIDVDSGELVADGCSTALESATYGAPVVCFGGGDGGGGGGGGAGGGGNPVPCE